MSQDGSANSYKHNTRITHNANETQMAKGNGKNGANGSKDPFGPARRQREYRQREKLKKEIEHAQANPIKQTYHIQADGSCIETWSHGTTIHYSAQQWTFYCKCVALFGRSPLCVQVEKPGEKPQLTMEMPTDPIPEGYGDKQWLKFCENDPDRDQVQIDIVNK